MKKTVVLSFILFSLLAGCRGESEMPLTGWSSSVVAESATANGTSFTGLMVTVTVAVEQWIEVSAAGCRRLQGGEIGPEALPGERPRVESVEASVRQYRGR